MSSDELDLEQLKMSIDSFFDKKDVSLESRYFVTKMMNEEYWEQILNEDDSDMEADDMLEVDDDEVERVPEPGDYDYDNEVEETQGSEDDDEVEDIEDSVPPKKIPRLELEPPRPRKSVKSLFKKTPIKTK